MSFKSLERCKTQVSVDTKVLPASAETRDPTSDDATQGGLASSLLLFRRG